MTLETTSSVMSEGDARRLTERIRYTALSVRDGVEKLQRLVGEAQEGQAHIALGYASWTAYLADVLGEEPLRLARDERRELVGWLAGEGMSTRAIAPIVGASFKTVARDLEAGPVSDDTPAQPPTIATTEGVVIAEQRRVEPTAFVVGPGIDGALDVTDWSEDEIAEVMDDDNAGVTYSNEPIPEAIPEPKPIIGKDGKTYQRPAPKPERRKPLPESFDSATYALKRAIEPLARLAADDRMEKNKDQIASVNLSDLIRVRDSLTGVINQLQGA